MAYNILNQPVISSAVITARNDDAFFFPNRLSFTGFGFDGFWYNNGTRNNAIQASWATEAASATRAGTPSFPTNALVLISQASISIFDISSGTLSFWMSFYKNDEYAFPTNFSTTSSSYSPSTVSFSTGLLSILLNPDAGSAEQAHAVLSIDFSQDTIMVFSTAINGVVTLPLNGVSGWTRVDPGMTIANGSAESSSTGTVVSAGRTIVASTGVLIAQAVLVGSPTSVSSRFGIANTASAKDPGNGDEELSAGFVAGKLQYSVNNVPVVMTPNTPVPSANYVITLAYLGNGELSLTAYPEADLVGLMGFSASGISAPNPMSTFYIESGSPEDTVSELSFSTGLAGTRFTLPTSDAIEFNVAPILRSAYNGMLVIAPASYTNTTKNPWVLVCHDFHTDVFGTVQQGMQGLFEPLLNAGYVLVMMNQTTQDTWGNQSAMTDLVEMLSEISTAFNLEAAPYVAGIGMGALVALNGIQRGIIVPRAFVGFSPVTALGAFYQYEVSQAAFDPGAEPRQLSIESAYNFTGAENQASATNGYDPSLANPVLFAGVPMILWQNDDDNVINANANAIAFAAAVNGAGGNVSIINSIGGYLDGAEFDGATVVNFFSQF